MVEISHDDVQMLLDHPKGQGMIVSCYADTSVREGFERRWAPRLKQEAAAVERRLAGDAQALDRFARDLAIVQDALKDPAVARARGMAVFSASAQGLFRAFALGVPVPDRLVLDEAPYLVPLLEAMHRQHRYLVVLTDTHHGQLHEAAWGRTHLLQELSADVPRHQHSAGERWGKQQATIARHREDVVLHYCKALARAIEDLWPTAPFRGLIVLGDLRTVETMCAALPVAIAERIVHRGRYSWATGTPTVDATVHDILDAARRDHDARLVAECDRRLREHYLIAAGPQEVVNALWNGQVGYPGYLVLEPDPGLTAAKCRTCASVFTTPHERCPACRGACERVNLWQEILLFASRHHVPAHTVERHPVLGVHGGIAAVLSRAEPWVPAPAGAAKAQ